MKNWIWLFDILNPEEPFFFVYLSYSEKSFHVQHMHRTGQTVLLFDTFVTQSAAAVRNES